MSTKIGEVRIWSILIKAKKSSLNSTKHLRINPKRPPKRDSSDIGRFGEGDIEKDDIEENDFEEDEIPFDIKRGKSRQQFR